MQAFNNAASVFRNVREQLAPLPKSSRFLEAGTLTPEEFVQAGDLLVLKCPTWQWSAGLPEKRREYLPPNKQYIVTKNVPSRRRVKELESEGDGLERIADGDWVETHVGNPVKIVGEIVDVNEPVEQVVRRIDELEVVEEQERPDDDDIPDIDEEDLLAQSIQVQEPEDPSMASPEDNIIKTRTYDVSITYDKYYQTPRVWLYGYDENRKPLTSNQIFEDISQEHAQKTVTIEQHPHESTSMASIHPCKHANVMKKILDNYAERSREEKGEALRVDLYMLVFLKFVSSVLPTIDYDYTVSF